MDKKRGLINVVVSIFFYFIVTIISFFTRRVLTQELGIGVSGLNSLYLSIIVFLSVAELGVGTVLGIPKCHKTLVKTLQIIAFQSTG